MNPLLVPSVLTQSSLLVQWDTLKVLQLEGRSSKTLLPILNPVHWCILALRLYPSICRLCFINLFYPESMLEVSKWKKGGVGADGLAAAVPSCVRLPTEHVLHLLEVHVGYGDGWWPFLLEAGLEVERHQEVLANQKSSAEARHTAQVLQVAPQEDGALALLATVTMHWQHVDVHSGGVWDMLSHCLLERRGYIEALMMSNHPWAKIHMHQSKYVIEKQGWSYCILYTVSICFHTCESLSLSQPEPMMKATSCPSSNQPSDSWGHWPRKLSTSSRVSGHSPDTETNARG